MKAMILAAGRGRRLGELTREVPKPLLPYRGKTFIEYRLLALAKAGIKEVIINTWYQGELLQSKLGNGERYGLQITYSTEDELLETGGGIKNALPLLDDRPFILTNSDLVTEFDYSKLPREINGLAHLVLVNNPSHHTAGDFCLQQGQVIPRKNGEPSLTYSGIAILNPNLFSYIEEKIFPLIKVLQPAIAQGQVSGEHFDGRWVDIGHPKELLEMGQ